MIINIKPYSAIPLYEQLRDQIILGIASKELVPYESLPSVRRLAADLGINFHTVNKAYAMLSDEGYIMIDRRKGTVIAPNRSDSEPVSSRLSRQLTLIAAEAVCHGISEKCFLTLCADHYKSVSGKNETEGKQQ